MSASENPKVYDIFYRSKVKKTAKIFPSKVKANYDSWVENELKTNPKQACEKSISNVNIAGYETPYYQKRFGGWRVLYIVSDKETEKSLGAVLIISIEPREKVYKSKR